MSGSHAHPHHPFDTTNPERYRASRRVTWVSVALNIVLTIAQVIVGLVGHSQALIADGFHTLSDLISDIIVLFALKQGAKAADDEHPYGHGRIETAVTLILGVLLIVVAVGIMWRAGERWFDAAPLVTPSAITFWVAVITFGAKEWLYRYTLRTAQRFDSAMLKANAWHHRSDAISSLIVIAGIGGAIYGINYLDGVAAMLVSVMVAKIGIELSWQALRELVDTGLDVDDRESIRRVIQSVDGVRALHLLRTRRLGDRAFVDVHILVDGELSVSEGHHIGETVRTRLIDEIEPVADVTVHIDSEEDLDGDPEADLPLRDEIVARLERYFATIPEARLIDRTTLHYVGGHVDIELRLPLSSATTPETGLALAARFAAAAKIDNDIGRVEVCFH
ncbi:MAG: cation transporter [Gammaproteobacteria bacterium]|nr:cation transporter [Gammaproteobacteria bacterium]